MAKKEQKEAPSEGLQLWKVVGVFALVFAAVQLAVAAFDWGITYLMDLFNASENVRVFIGSTIARAGMIALVILITVPVIRSVLKKPGLGSIYPRAKKSWKDFLFGFGIATGGMLIVFLLELALGWITVEGFALAGEPTEAFLRAMWLAILVNLTTAVGEEVLYRGLLMQGVQEAWDAWGALFISAIIFGSSHIIVTGTSESDWLNLIPLMALPGIMLGWAYLRTGNLWLATGIHFAWNIFQDDILNLTGGHTGSTHFGLVTEISGPKWFTGTSYGIEVGAAGILCLIFVTFSIWWWTKQRYKENIK